MPLPIGFNTEVSRDCLIIIQAKTLYWCMVQGYVIAYVYNFHAYVYEMYTNCCIKYEQFSVCFRSCMPEVGFNTGVSGVSTY